MTSKAQLIYKSYMTYFHTFLPVYFYGMPDGKIYCMYARFYDSKSGVSELEFVFAEHEDFTYDYNNGIISTYGQEHISLPVFKEMVDQPEQRIKLVKVYNGLQSYSEAQQFLNQNIEIQLNNIEMEMVQL